MQRKHLHKHSKGLTERLGGQLLQRALSSQVRAYKEGQSPNKTLLNRQNRDHHFEVTKPLGENLGRGGIDLVPEKRGFGLGNIEFNYSVGVVMQI